MKANAAQVKQLMDGISEVLADCLAIWLAGHHVPGDEDATRTMRAELLATHCFEVRNLVPVNARIIGTMP